MPTIADFRVIDDGSYTFSVPEPNPFTGPEVIEYVFRTQTMDTETKSILLFRLHPEGEGDCRLVMHLNGTYIFGRTLTAGIERSMHVAIPSGILKASENNLSISKVDGGAAVTVSEFIVFFQAAIA
jgi:hypothetical protein